MRITFVIPFLLFLFGCNTSKKIRNAEIPATDMVELDETATEERSLDTMVVTAPRDLFRDISPEFISLPPYNPSPKRNNDLLHTKLEVSFDWTSEKVFGKATLRFAPYFKKVDQLELDAKGFEIKKIALLPSMKELKYDYNREKLVIYLDRAYSRSENYEIFIDYIASPSETGGSAAITSDRGLFFINPRGEDPEKPKQIWTQGETEWNSKWFPTIDKPNERCTQEMFITVDTNFVTLSNGVLTSSKDNKDGTRTDYWKMDQPHAPYLFMMAIGEFSIVNDKWEDIPLSYYVEPEYENSAKAIFSNTPEMISFFSNKLDLKFPWPKYAQIIVKDYVSGAMENTTSSVFGDFIQKHERELIDNHNESIVAHELIHQWFGDYVTCESWSNLTMNEGFANYSEYMWLENKYGRDEADYHLLNEWEGYFASAQNEVHPLIHFGYDDKEDMFDAHSYNKGGSVLHMLRKYLGDEIFWTGLNKYLKDNAYKSVEVHNLRLAFEEVSGEDLNWFFNQWYLSQGHPLLDISYGFNQDSSKAILKVVQKQDEEKMVPIFKLPVGVDIYLNDGQEPLHHQIIVDKREQVFEFIVPSKPKLITFDPERMLLARVNNSRTAEDYIFQFNNSKRFLDKYESLEYLINNDSLSFVLDKAIRDGFWYIRGIALQNITEPTQSQIELFKSLAITDPHSQIRAVALSKLYEAEDDGVVNIAKEVLDKELAYDVIAVALDVLIQKDKSVALEYAKKLEGIQNDDLLDVIGALYSESGSPDAIPYFQKNLKKINGYTAISFYTYFQGLLQSMDDKTMLENLNVLKEIATTPSQSIYRKLAATNAINDMRNHFRLLSNEVEDEGQKKTLEEKVNQISQMMDAIKDAETNGQLKEIYENRLKLIEKA